MHWNADAVFEQRPERRRAQTGDRCEVCGTKLTAAEMQAALESGGPAMCSIHADEVVPVTEDEQGLESP